MTRKLKIATRSSPLAVKQAEMAVEYLSKHLENCEFEISTFKTGGDRRQDWSLEKFGGMGLFTKELEDALINNQADIAVHSAKDLPTQINKDLYISALMPRDASKDVMAIKDSVELPTLIATSSPRRRIQLKKMFPQAVWGDIRGSVETRLRKIALATNDSAQATILSSAGLLRLGIKEFEGIKFKEIKIRCCVPAVAQGIIALQTRADLRDEISQYSHIATQDAFYLERRFLESLGGGCQAAYAAHFDGELFHFFHENCGYQKYKFAATSLSERLLEVNEIARGIL